MSYAGNTVVCVHAQACVFLMYNLKAAANIQGESSSLAI